MYLPKPPPIVVGEISIIIEDNPVSVTYSYMAEQPATDAHPKEPMMLEILSDHPAHLIDKIVIATKEYINEQSIHF